VPVIGANPGGLPQIGQESERVKLEVGVNKETVRSHRIAGVLPVLKRAILRRSDHLKKAQEPKQVVSMDG